MKTATISLETETYDFIQTFAANNGLDPNDVMAEAVTQWHRMQEAEINAENGDLKGSDTL